MSENLAYRILTPGEIRKLRYDSGLTLSEFANLFGVSGAAITNWELGRSMPSPYYLAGMNVLRQRLNQRQVARSQAVGNQSVPPAREDNTLRNALLAGGAIAFFTWLIAEATSDAKEAAPRPKPRAKTAARKKSSK